MRSFLSGLMALLLLQSCLKDKSSEPPIEFTGCRLIKVVQVSQRGPFYDTAWTISYDKQNRINRVYDSYRGRSHYRDVLYDGKSRIIKIRDSVQNPNLHIDFSYNSRGLLNRIDYFRDGKLHLDFKYGESSRYPLSITKSSDAFKGDEIFMIYKGDNLVMQTSNKGFIRNYSFDDNLLFQNPELCIVGFPFDGMGQQYHPEFYLNRNAMTKMQTSSGMKYIFYQTDSMHKVTDIFFTPDSVLNLSNPEIIHHRYSYECNSK